MIGLVAGKMERAVRRFACDESGATAIEYALIATSIFLVILASVGLIAPALSAIFTQVSGSL